MRDDRGGRPGRGRDAMSLAVHGNPFAAARTRRNRPKPGGDRKNVESPPPTLTPPSQLNSPPASKPAGVASNLKTSPLAPGFQEVGAPLEASSAAMCSRRAPDTDVNTPPA